MRIIALLLSLYIFALSAVQCTDVIEDDHGVQKEQLSTKNHGHQDSNESDDDCSPFCSCTCCQLQAHVFKPLLMASENIAFKLVEDYSFYAQHYLSQYLEAPFHPPKTVV